MEESREVSESIQGRVMDKFISLDKMYQIEEKRNIYLSDGFIPKYGFDNMVSEHVIKRDRITIPKRSLRKNDK